MCLPFPVSSRLTLNTQTHRHTHTFMPYPFLTMSTCHALSVALAYVSSLTQSVSVGSFIKTLTWPLGSSPRPFPRPGPGCISSLSSSNPQAYSYVILWLHSFHLCHPHCLSSLRSGLSFDFWLSQTEQWSAVNTEKYLDRYSLLDWDLPQSPP